MKNPLSFFLPISFCLALWWLVLVFRERLVYVGLEGTTALQRLLEVFTVQYFKVVTQYYGRLYFILIFPVKLASLGPIPFLLGFGPGMLGDRALAILDVNVLGEVFGIRRDVAHLIVDVNWAYILGQAGAVGLTCFAWMFVRLLHAVYVIHKRTDDLFLKWLALGVLGALVMLIVSACFAPVWEIRPLALYAWLYAGIVVKLGYRHVYSVPLRGFRTQPKPRSGTQR